MDSRKTPQKSLLALQVSERRWLGLYENTAVGIALADRDGCIPSANPALQRCWAIRAARSSGSI